MQDLDIEEELRQSQPKAAQSMPKSAQSTPVMHISAATAMRTASAPPTELKAPKQTSVTAVTPKNTVSEDPDELRRQMAQLQKELAASQAREGAARRKLQEDAQERMNQRAIMEELQRSLLEQERKKAAAPAPEPKEAPWTQVVAKKSLPPGIKQPAAAAAAATTSANKSTSPSPGTAPQSSSSPQYSTPSPSHAASECSDRSLPNPDLPPGFGPQDSGPAYNPKPYATAVLNAPQVPVTPVNRAVANTGPGYLQSTFGPVPVGDEWHLYETLPITHLVHSMWATFLKKVVELNQTYGTPLGPRQVLRHITAYYAYRLNDSDRGKVDRDIDQARRNGIEPLMGPYQLAMQAAKQAGMELTPAQLQEDVSQPIRRTGPAPALAPAQAAVLPVALPVASVQPPPAPLQVGSKRVRFPDSSDNTSGTNDLNDQNDDNDHQANRNGNALNHDGSSATEGSAINGSKRNAKINLPQHPVFDGTLKQANIPDPERWIKDLVRWTTFYDNISFADALRMHTQGDARSWADVTIDLNDPTGKLQVSTNEKRRNALQKKLVDAFITTYIPFNGLKTYQEKDKLYGNEIVHQKGEMVSLYYTRFLTQCAKANIDLKDPTTDLQGLIIVFIRNLLPNFRAHCAQNKGQPWTSLEDVITHVRQKETEINLVSKLSGLSLANYAGRYRNGSKHEKHDKHHDNAYKRNGYKFGFKKPRTDQNSGSQAPWYKDTNFTAGNSFAGGRGGRGAFRGRGGFKSHGGGRGAQGSRIPANPHSQRQRTFAAVVNMWKSHGAPQGYSFDKDGAQKFSEDMAKQGVKCPICGGTQGLPNHAPAQCPWFDHYAPPPNQ